MSILKSLDLDLKNESPLSELIQQRRLQLLVHSCLYYHYDINIVSDKTWDKWAKELVQLQKDNPEISKQVIWYDAFKDWDASTGAFLPLTDTWVVRKATQIAELNGIYLKSKKDL